MSGPNSHEIEVAQVMTTDGSDHYHVHNWRTDRHVCIWQDGGFILACESADAKCDRPATGATAIEFDSFKDAIARALDIAGRA
jgi:hypothetical protein